MTKKEKLKKMNKVLKPLEDILNQHYDKYIKEKKVETVIEDDSTLPAGEYNLVQGWDEGFKIKIK